MPWRNTTHDWASTVDAEHLVKIRQHPTVFAPGGSLHLILEVMAYAADEAKSTSSGCCVVTLHGDNSVSRRRSRRLRVACPRSPITTESLFR